MILTVLPMSLNLITGVALWMSDLSLLPKIIITIILVAKFALYFYTALMAGSDRAKSFGLITCVAANIALVVYFVVNAVWNAILGCAALAILALVWGGISGFTFKKED